MDRFCVELAVFEVCGLHLENQLENDNQRPRFYPIRIGLSNIGIPTGGLERCLASSSVVGMGTAPRSRLSEHKEHKFGRHSFEPLRLWQVLKQHILHPWASRFRASDGCYKIDYRQRNDETESTIDNFSNRFHTRHGYGARRVYETA